MLRILCCCAFLISLAFAVLGSAQEMATETPKEMPKEMLKQMSQDEMMEMVMKLAVPSEEHKLLESLAGEWNLDVTLWMEPGAEPMYFKGQTTNELILGGRFLVSESHSGEGDMYTETFWIMGFDRRFGHYTYLGMDTWGTYYIDASGDYDAETKVLQLTGEVDDPMFGEEQFKTILRFENKDRYIVEMFMDNKAFAMDEFKMVELTYTRG